MILIGSRALEKCCPGALISRNFKDTDLIGTVDEVESFFRRHGIPMTYVSKGKALGREDHLIYDVEVAWPGSSGRSLLEILEKNPHLVHSTYSGGFLVPVMDVLYALKMSHRYLRNSPHFLKTMRSIRAMRAMGAKVPEELEGWMVQRERETYWYQHPSLNRSKKDFFKDEVLKYVYDHDSIHEAVAIGDVPAYQLFKKDGAEVQTDRSKFESLPVRTRLNAVLEESYVLALERSVIPHGSDPEKAFMMALEKVCTSITSGWFREFAWENYEAVVSRFHQLEVEGSGYFQKFTSGLERGIIKPYN